MHNRFVADTAVRPLPALDGADCYEGTVDPGWFLARGPQGGYVAAIMLRAMSETVGDGQRSPRSMTAHFTETPAAGPVVIQAQAIRRGRSVTTVEARMTQEDRVVGVGIAGFSRSRPSLEFNDLRMPSAPPPEECPASPVSPAAPSIVDRYEFRWAIGDTPYSGSGSARCGGWVRLAEPMRPDAALVAAYCDGWPHALFSRITPAAGIAAVPTVDLTIHFRETLPLPTARESDYCLAVFETGVAADGFVEEDGEIWSREGVLLAQSRALGIILLDD